MDAVQCNCTGRDVGCEPVVWCCDLGLGHAVQMVDLRRCAEVVHQFGLGKKSVRQAAGGSSAKAMQKRASAPEWKQCASGSLIRKLCASAYCGSRTPVCFCGSGALGRKLCGCGREVQAEYPGQIFLVRFSGKIRSCAPTPNCSLVHSLRVENLEDYLIFSSGSSHARDSSRDFTSHSLSPLTLAITTYR